MTHWAVKQSIVGMVKGEVWRNRSQHDLKGKSCLGIGQMTSHRQLFWRGGVG
jgi:hypothetical protein